MCMPSRSLLLFCVASSLCAQGVTFDRLLHPDKEPQNWLTYSGSNSGQRYSLLNQITPANVKNLELQWVWQAKSTEKFEATALVNANPNLKLIMAICSPAVPGAAEAVKQAGKQDQQKTGQQTGQQQGQQGQQGKGGEANRSSGANRDQDKNHNNNNPNNQNNKR